MTPLESAIVGISLAASAGLRTFLPLLVSGLLVRYSDLIEPSAAMAWAASDEGLLILAVATAVEIAADKIPLVDNLLDAFQTVAKPVAGTVLAAGFAQALSPELSWGLGLLVGAPAALGVHSLKASARQASSGFTAGAANPVLSVAEDVLTVVLVVLAIIAPLVAIALVVGLAALLVRSWRRRRARRRTEDPG